ncbi:MAG: lipoprotein insertase outer membrane protein LolB [Betaproteobacteria bacterium]
MAGAAALAVLLAISGCAALSDVAASSVRARGAFVPAQEKFEASGRVSLRHGAQALTANFRWLHQGERDEIDLASPLGQTLARLSGAPGAVSLRLADGSATSAPDWATLMSRSLEWALPIEGLGYWIQGVPRPGAAFEVEWGADGAPALLRQDGWTVVYQPFVRDPSGRMRPARLALSYPDTEVRVAVDAWL